MKYSEGSKRRLEIPGVDEFSPFQGLRVAGSMKLFVLIGQLIVLTSLFCWAADFLWSCGPASALAMFLGGGLLVLLVVDRMLGF